MEIEMGVIRDKQGIYDGLLQGRSLEHQLAVCYTDDGKLLVKICSVVSIDGNQKKARVTLRSQADHPGHETTIDLDDIQSIYPIRDFFK
jgi:hypothetical protein